jgi:hypothetical protein
MDENKIRKMKCSELKEELKKIKQPIYGIKALLIERLLDYYTKEKVFDTEAIGIYIIY